MLADDCGMIYTCASCHKQFTVNLRHDLCALTSQTVHGQGGGLEPSSIINSNNSNANDGNDNNNNSLLSRSNLH